ncbi:MAG TPA: hypothetical protein VKV15_25855 [Bryobacteraceae bacterium]|nr:hypothetical protein [Bryobacteraceae bacterium]
MKVRSGQLNRSAAGGHRSRFLVDIASGGVEVYHVTRDHVVTGGAAD